MVYARSVPDFTLCRLLFANQPTKKTWLRQKTKGYFGSQAPASHLDGASVTMVYARSVPDFTLCRLLFAKQATKKTWPRQKTKGEKQGHYSNQSPVSNLGGASVTMVHAKSVPDKHFACCCLLSKQPRKPGHDRRLNKKSKATPPVTLPSYTLHQTGWFSLWSGRHEYFGPVSTQTVDWLAF